MGQTFYFSNLLDMYAHGVLCALYDYDVWQTMIENYDGTYLMNDIIVMMTMTFIVVNTHYVIR